MPSLKFLALIAIGLITLGAGLSLLSREATPGTRRLMAAVMVSNLFIAALILLF